MSTLEGDVKIDLDKGIDSTICTLPSTKWSQAFSTFIKKVEARLNTDQMQKLVSDVDVKGAYDQDLPLDVNSYPGSAIKDTVLKELPALVGQDISYSKRQLEGSGRLVNLTVPTEYLSKQPVLSIIVRGNPAKLSFDVDATLLEVMGGCKR